MTYSSHQQRLLSIYPDLYLYRIALICRSLEEVGKDISAVIILQADRRNGAWELETEESLRALRGEEGLSIASYYVHKKHHTQRELDFWNSVVFSCSNGRS
jgi:hypothetical protein